MRYTGNKKTAIIIIICEHKSQPMRLFHLRVNNKKSAKFTYILFFNTKILIIVTKNKNFTDDIYF